MPGEREARGKGIYSVKKILDLSEMDSLPLAAQCRFRLRQGYGGRNVSTPTRRSFSGDGRPGMTNISI